MSKLQIVIVAIASCVILGAGAMLIKTAMEYKQAESEYENLTQYTAQTDTAQELPAEPVSPVELPEEEEEPVKELRQNLNREDFPDIEVDFDGLKEVNSDFVAWLYVGAVGISYPVVQGEDNEYYLHQTFEDKKNSSGCIFMDWEVKKDLSSWNTFIYGHNMKNGTMFGSLKQFIWNNHLYEKDPYIYLFTEDGIYRYQIYSFYLDSPDSKMYWTCDTIKEYRQYIRTALGKSVYDCQTEATEEDNSVTLVTCSGTGSSKQRFFVHGIFIDRYLY
ncbi:MAG TPA: class B sortase [Lachnospiraceae bacterium]|nr:class B sortase [Lachnospiraceae bacterium]